MASALISRFKELMRDRRGNVLVLAGAGLFALIGGAGLGTDTVQWYLWKRQLQQAVDSGALAGAHALSQGVTDFDPAARAEVNGNANTTVTIEQIRRPASGAFTADPSAVEVIATTSATLPFSSLFLSSAPVIRARSVAAYVFGGQHCVIARAPSGVGVKVTGSAQVKLGCGVAANSSSSTAITLSGTSFLTASPLSTVGGIDADAARYPSGAQLNPYGPPQADPVAKRNLRTPVDPSECSHNDFAAENSSTSLQPGRYCGGMDLKGRVDLDPGVYIVDGGTFKVNAGANITGDNVTIILTGDRSSAQINGGSTLDLSAPTSDPTWKNILFYQDPNFNAAASTFNGGSTMNLRGIVYMPSADLTYNGGNSMASTCLLMVVNTVEFSGNAELGNNCTDLQDDFRSRRVRVVE